MNVSIAAPATLPGLINSQPREKGSLCGIVLAGGEGLRLRPLTRRLYGDERPKQYAAVVGARSMLRQTLDRVRLIQTLRILLRRLGCNRSMHALVQ